MSRLHIPTTIMENKQHIAIEDSKTGQVCTFSANIGLLQYCIGAYMSDPDELRKTQKTSEIRDACRAEAKAIVKQLPEYLQLDVLREIYRSLRGDFGSEVSILNHWWHGIGGWKA